MSRNKRIIKIPSGSKFYEYLYFSQSHFFITYKHSYKVVKGDRSLQFINSLKHAAGMTLLARHRKNSYSSKKSFSG